MKQITVQHLNGIYMLAVDGIEPIVMKDLDYITNRVRAKFGAPFHIHVEELSNDTESPEAL